ncbi:hypothetical protein ACP4J4_00175 [Aureimonas ureilytica]|uniref:hypothetical protein n=1 Tax=Aureimonas ureilytica TaxID=401562 RepID=UPI003CF77D10
MNPLPAPPLRLRGMAPGDGPALARIEAEAVRDQADGAPRSPAELTPFLLRHEVFVAEDAAGRVNGFAAAAPLSSLVAETDGEGAEGCFWIGALRVDPSSDAEEVAEALLGAVAERAEWFFCRALAISLPCAKAEAAPFFRRKRFLVVEPDGWTPALRKRFEAECPPDVSPEARCVLVRWL